MSNIHKVNVRNKPVVSYVLINKCFNNFDIFETRDGRLFIQLVVSAFAAASNEVSGTTYICRG